MTNQKLDGHYGDYALSIRSVNKWFKNFRWGHMSTTDAERFEWLVEVTTPEIIDEMNDMVIIDRRMEMHGIASAVDISNQRVYNINTNIWTWESYQPSGSRQLLPID